MAEPEAVDDDTDQLIVQLLTRAGMVMEDASAEAILSARKGVSLTKVIARLENASDRIAALVAAAKVLAHEQL